MMDGGYVGGVSGQELPPGDESENQAVIVKALAAAQESPWARSSGLRCVRRSVRRLRGGKQEKEGHPRQWDVDVEEG